MKILFITSRYTPSNTGVSIACSRVTVALKKRGHDILVLTRDPDDESPPGFGRFRKSEVDGIPVYYFPEKWLGLEACGLCLSDLIRPIAEFRPLIIHAYYAVSSGYIGVILARKLGIPLVVSCRGSDITRDLLINSSNLKAVLHAADIVTAVADSLLKWGEIIARYKASKTVHNSIESTDWKQNRNTYTVDIRRKLGIPPDSPVIGTVAEFRWVKGTDYLERMLRTLTKDLSVSFSFILMGVFDSDLQDRLARSLSVANANNTQGRLITVSDPDRDDLPQLLSILDLFVLTSKREGMPNVLLEAMASGTAVAATAVNGCCELVEKTRAGILLDPFDPEAGAVEISRLISDKTKLHRLSERGRKFVANEYTIDSEINSIFDIYKSLI